jgi:hypothetical protein
VETSVKGTALPTGKLQGKLLHTGAKLATSGVVWVMVTLNGALVDGPMLTQFRTCAVTV